MVVPTFYDRTAFFRLRLSNSWEQKKMCIRDRLYFHGTRLGARCGYEPGRRCFFGPPGSGLPGNPQLLLPRPIPFHMIQMDIQLREGNRNFLLIKGKLHSFLHGIIQVPVVAAAAPQLCHQCHGTLLQFPHRYNRSGCLLYTSRCV